MRSQVHRYLRTLTCSLKMGCAELVLAYVCLERALMMNTTIMRCYTVRPMLLAACLVATKVTRDDVVTLMDCHKRLSPVLTNVTPIHLRRLESTVRAAALALASLVMPSTEMLSPQMLKLLDWRIPTGGVHEICESHCPYARCAMRARLVTYGL